MGTAKIKFKFLLPVIALFFLALFYSLSTHFSPIASGSYGHDAGIFAYIGLAMKEGRTLYTEVWENKGPLLYVINLLGLSLNYKHGIFLLEIATLFFTLFFLYKTARLFYNIPISLLSAVFSSIPLSVTLEGGNLSEEYALPFISICLYFAAKFVKQDCNLKNYEYLIIGMTVSAVFLLRLNILAYQFCLVLMALILVIARKEFKKLINIFIFAILGFALFTTPFLIYLIKNNALEACIETAYFGTLSSFYDVGTAARVTNVINMMENFISSGSYFVIFVFLAALPATKLMKTKFTTQTNKITPLLWACYGGLFFNLFANSLSGVNHMHYFMTFIPLILLPCAWVFGFIYNVFREKVFTNEASAEQLSSIVTFALAFLMCVTAIPKVSHMVLNNLRTAAVAEKQYTLMGEFILDNSAPDDTIQTFGRTGVTAYYRTKRLSASKYSYYANGYFSDEAKHTQANSIANDIYKEKPKLIIIDMKGKYDDFVAHLEQPDKWNSMIENDYELAENNFSCIIYKQK